MANTSNLDLVKPAGTDHALISVINSNMDKVDAYAGKVNTSLAGVEDGLAIVATGNTHAAITAGQFVYVKEHNTLPEGLYTASSNIAANATLSTTNLTADSKGGLNALSDHIANNYTDYNVSNDYNIRVCQLGKMVVVSGIIYGTATAEYCGPSLPSPAMYNDGVINSNAVVFHARNQSTGAIVQLRCGGNFRIYREASMTNGVQFAFGFAYCAK